MKFFFVALLGLSSSVICLAQSNQPPKSDPEQSIMRKQIGELRPAKRSFRPSLTLQNALKVAEDYIVKEKIDLSPYYLLEAKYILYGSKDNQEPGWRFWWVNEDGALGDYVEIVVSIKSGKARRLLSM